MGNWLRTGMQIVPTTNTVVTNQDCKIFQMLISNNGTNTIIITILDGQVPPIPLLKLSMPKNTTQLFNLEHGVFMNGGFSWFASANGITAAIVFFTIQ